MRAIVEPNTQPHVGVIKHAGWNSGRHVRNGRIAEQNRVETITYGKRDSICGFAPVGAGIVVAPKSRRARCVDQRELELAGAVEVCRSNDNATLVVNDLRDLRVQS